MAELKRKSISGTVLYVIFIIAYLVLGGALIFFALSKAWVFAEEYEAAIPTNVMDEYIAGLNENLWDDSIARTIETMPHEYRSDVEVAALVQEMFSSELSYARTIGGDGVNVLVYAILCDGNAFGKVTLVRDESKADQIEFGSLPWKIESEEFDFTGLYSSLKVTVPADYSVAVNGHILGEDTIIARDIHYDVLEEYYADYPGLPTKVTYKAEHLLGHLEATIYDEFGNETVPDPTQDDSQYIRPIDGDTWSRLESFALGFSDPYLAFSSFVRDPYSGLAALEPYLYPNGDLYQRLKFTLDGYGWAHTTSYRFDGAQLISAVALGGGYYSINIHAQSTITYPNKGENGVVRDNNGLKVTVVEYNGGFRAIDVERYQVN